VTANQPFELEARFLIGPNAAGLNGTNEVTRDLSRAYLASGMRLRSESKIELALEHLEEAVRLARLNTDRLTEGAGLSNLGNLYYDWHDMAQALHHYHRAREIAHSLGARRGEAYILFNMSLALNALELRGQAVQSAVRSLTMLEEIRDPDADRVRTVLAQWQGDTAHAS
jgi:tetratricopeptide (TPR) repeat protein